jgi:hypothetical protein
MIQALKDAESLLNEEPLEEACLCDTRKQEVDKRQENIGCCEDGFISDEPV